MELSAVHLTWAYIGQQCVHADLPLGVILQLGGLPSNDQNRTASLDHNEFNRGVHINAVDFFLLHYPDVIMSTIKSQITSPTIVYSTVYSGADQRKHQSSAPLAFVRGIHRRPVNSPHKGPVTRKMFPFDDVIIFFSGHLYERSVGSTDASGIWSGGSDCIHVGMPDTHRPNKHRVCGCYGINYVPRHQQQWHCWK